VLADGAMVQYYINYSTRVANTCPESAPAAVQPPTSYPCPLDYIDGSTVTTPWTFIVHL
jgi:hypothetical protein